MSEIKFRNKIFVWSWRERKSTTLLEKIFKN